MANHSDATRLAKSLRTAADNLFQQCMHAGAGESVLLVCEDPAEGYYDQAAPEAVAMRAAECGLKVRAIQAPVLESADTLPGDIADAMNQADHTVFFARIGDQMRFAPQTLKNPPVIMYTVDAEMLGSALGTADHTAFCKIKKCFDELAVKSREIVITCPKGTHLQGSLELDQRDEEVQARRFPALVTQPFSADRFSGQVVLSQFLTGTGVHLYAPYTQLITGDVIAQVDRGRVTGLDGAPSDVEIVRQHHEKVADRYGLDAWRVHSWHAGIHPGCSYRKPAAEDWQRWSGAAFGNPRLLHFHTCTGDAPGDISWNLVDASVSFDGATVWDEGMIRAKRVPGLVNVLDDSGLGDIFAHPDRHIGL